MAISGVSLETMHISKSRTRGFVNDVWSGNNTTTRRSDVRDALHSYFFGTGRRKASQTSATTSRTRRSSSLSKVPSASLSPKRLGSRFLDCRNVAALECSADGRVDFSSDWVSASWPLQASSALPLLNLTSRLLLERGHTLSSCTRALRFSPLWAPLLPAADAGPVNAKSTPVLCARPEFCADVARCLAFFGSLLLMRLLAIQETRRQFSRRNSIPRMATNTM